MNDFKNSGLNLNDLIREFNSNSKNSMEKIGEGAYGDVYCLKNKETCQKIALKVMDRDVEDPESYSNFVNEINILGQFFYPTILTLYGYKEQSNITMMFTEYLENGPLSSFFEDSTKYNQLDYNQRFIIGYGIALGIQYLHNNNVTHGDLKLENILLNKNFFPTICDFGFATLLGPDSTKSRNHRGTPIFSAPEINLNFNDYFYSSSSSNLSSSSELNFLLNQALIDLKKADIYSYGVILLCLFLNSYNDVQNLLIDRVKPYIYINSHKYEIKYYNIIENCCNENPELRPDINAIVEIMKSEFEKQLKLNNQLYQNFDSFIKTKKSKKLILILKNFLIIVLI